MHVHRRAYERARSRKPKGGLKRGPYQDVIDARDADPGYTPTKHRR